MEDFRSQLDLLRNIGTRRSVVQRICERVFSGSKEEVTFSPRLPLPPPHSPTPLSLSHSLTFSMMYSSHQSISWCDQSFTVRTCTLSFPNTNLPPVSFLNSRHTLAGDIERAYFKCFKRNLILLSSHSHDSFT